jgi:hypothetical protein
MNSKTLKRTPEDSVKSSFAARSLSMPMQGLGEDSDESMLGRSGNEQLDKILSGGVTDAYRRPWHRLERGLRLNRLRAFAADETARIKLTQFESAQLLTLLQKALEKKYLNSKTTVIYDPDEEKIKEIKGLVSHRDSDGIIKYKFLEKKTGVTMRRKRPLSGGAGAETE